MTFDIVDRIGRYTINFTAHLGDMAIFLWHTLVTFCTNRFSARRTLYQMRHIGVNSSTVVLLTGASIGCVLAYQAYIGLHRFGGEQFIGPVVFLAMVREFGPVLSAIMVSGRAGSAITAEIGTMRISEQIDALETMCMSVQNYLMVPRLIASIFIMPLLSLFCSLCGLAGGYMVSIYVLGVNSELFLRSIRENAELFDITSGLYKAIVFGFLIAWIANYKGYTATGGARGIGIATTQSVVSSCVSIFIADYILTAFMF